jgi:hypothetical protein
MGAAGIGSVTAMAFRAGGTEHDISQGVPQIVARVVAAEFDGGGGAAVEAEMSKLKIEHDVDFLDTI